MRGAIEDYVEAKHGSGGPDADRFDGTPDDEVHTSQIAACQRGHYWDRTRGKPNDVSVYFELGRVFEMMYGAVLAWERGSLDREDLVSNKPWELVDLVPEVEQDVGIRVDFGGASITGEADWAVYRDGAMPMVREKGGVDRIERAEDGTIAVKWHDGEVTEVADTPFEEVIETKTKKDLAMLGDGPQAKHFWQTYGYMYAMNCPGKVTYMQRNDWQHRDYPLERSEASDMDLEVRVRRKVGNLASDDVPIADPNDKWECYYCAHRASCGESMW